MKHWVTISFLSPWSVMPFSVSMQVQKAMILETESGIEESNWYIFIVISIGNSRRWTGWTNSKETWGMETTEESGGAEQGVHTSGRVEVWKLKGHKHIADGCDTLLMDGWICRVSWKHQTEQRTPLTRVLNEYFLMWGVFFHHYDSVTGGEVKYDLSRVLAL